MAAVGAAQTPSATDSAPTTPASTRVDTVAPAWLVADAAARTVTMALQVTRAPDGGALINGHRKGELQIVVPLNWTVQWDWRNADSTAPHSLVVMVEREKLPTEGGRAAFTNAMSRSVAAGLAAGQGDRTTFEADEAGWFWLLCGVPSHALGGEYLGLRVDPDAKTASVKQK
ncbi:MAG TPA: sulfocyanin-like copper-binding protein [Gemmatimonadales bacterium]|nr:sulfocyanin-like copper-binding protein [Gemmatimonadales bacterium]